MMCPRAGACSSRSNKHPSTRDLEVLEATSTHSPDIVPLYASRAYAQVHTRPSRATLGSLPSVYRSNYASPAPRSMPKGTSSATAPQPSAAVTFARLTPSLHSIIYGLRFGAPGMQCIIKAATNTHLRAHETVLDFVSNIPLQHQTLIHISEPTRQY